MTLFLALMLQAAPAAEPQRDIVVTGQRLETTAAALKACIERRCPTDEDVSASLAHAENQFVAGDYRAARQTLGTSIGRNKRNAKSFPIPVGDLWRANARMNQHLGEGRLYRLNQIESLSALKAGLPSSDGRVFAQRVEIADADARIGRVEGALAAYATIADEAHKVGLATIEAHARLRRVMLLTAISNINGGYEPDLRAAVQWFVDRPELRAFRTVAELMAAQHAARKGDPAALDAIIAASARTTARPQLIYAPIVSQQTVARLENGGSVTNRLGINNYDGQWVDIGFFVTAEGKVADISILREGPKLDREWVKPITDSIARRRYAPLAIPKDEPGLLRVERYTLTAFIIEGATGTRISTRESIPRVQMIDLTADPGIPAAPKG